jgi:hypothetical protein
LGKFLGACNGSVWYIFWPFGIFYSILVYFTATWYIFCLFGIFYPVLVYFPIFGMFYQEKSGNPAAGQACFISELVLGITKEFAPSKKSLTAMSKYIHARH